MSSKYDISKIRPLSPHDKNSVHGRDVSFTENCDAKISFTFFVSLYLASVSGTSPAIRDVFPKRMGNVSWLSVREIFPSVCREIFPDLRRNTWLRLQRNTSLLGEKYLSACPPPSPRPLAAFLPHSASLYLLPTLNFYVVHLLIIISHHFIFTQFLITWRWELRDHRFTWWCLWFLIPTEILAEFSWKIILLFNSMIKALHHIMVWELSWQWIYWKSFSMHMPWSLLDLPSCHLSMLFLVSMKCLWIGYSEKSVQRKVNWVVN